MTSNAKEVVIPKKKRIVTVNGEKAGQTEMHLRAPTSEEAESLIGEIKSSLSDRKLRKYMNIQDIQIVDNQNLVHKFANMKNNVLDVEHRSETLGFLLVGSNKDRLSTIVDCGLSVNSLLRSELGVSDQGVTVYRHVDQVNPSPLFANLKMKIMFFKTLRGKSLEVRPGSSLLDPSLPFNSHIAPSPLAPSLSQLEQFEQSAVLHFEFNETGESVKIPSGVLPCAVFTLLYNNRRVSARSPSRLKPYYQLLKASSVIPTSGVFSGSRCRFSSLSYNTIGYSILDLYSLNVREELYQHKDLLKLPQLQPLLEMNNWGKLFDGIESELRIDGKAKLFVSYWGFTSNSPDFPSMVSKMETEDLDLIGFCGNTLLFLIPNGHLASLLGLPFVDCPILHCIAVNPDVSALGLPPNKGDVYSYERSVCTKDSADKSSNIDAILLKQIQLKRIENRVPIKKVKSVNWADEAGKVLTAIRDIPGRRSLDFMKENSIAASTQSPYNQVQNEGKGSFATFHRQEQQRLACYHDARRVMHVVQNIGHEPNDIHEVEISGHNGESSSNVKRGGQIDLCWMPMLNSPGLPSIDLHASKDNDAGSSRDKEDPIAKSVPRFTKTSTSLDVYNGCITMGYAGKGDRRSPLISMPSSEPALFGSPRKRLHTSSSSPAQAPCSNSRAEKLTMTGTVAPMDKETALISNQLLIVVDSDLLYYELMKSTDFGMMLRRLKFDKTLTSAPHKVLYHLYAERSLRDWLHNDGTPMEKKKSLEEYLFLLESYREQNLVVAMEFHGCDRVLDQNKLHCLGFAIAAARKENRLINVVYLTDLKRCSIMDSFLDERVRFIDYRSWIDIFDEAPQLSL